MSSHRIFVFMSWSTTVICEKWENILWCNFTQAALLKSFKQYLQRIALSTFLHMRYILANSLDSISWKEANPVIQWEKNPLRGGGQAYAACCCCLSWWICPKLSSWRPQLRENGEKIGQSLTTKQLISAIQNITWWKLYLWLFSLSFRSFRQAALSASMNSGIPLTAT